MNKKSEEKITKWPSGMNPGIVIDRRPDGKPRYKLVHKIEKGSHGEIGIVPIKFDERIYQMLVFSSPSMIVLAAMFSEKCRGMGSMKKQYNEYVETTNLIIRKHLLGTNLARDEKKAWNHILKLQKKDEDYEEFVSALMPVAKNVRKWHKKNDEAIR